MVPADVDAGLDRVQDTWDDAHLGAWGEVRVAASVADSLATLGVGPPADRPLTLPPRGPRLRSTLTAQSGDGSVRLSWTLSPGATATELWVRDETVGAPWTSVGSAAWPQTSWQADGLPEGHVFGFRVVPVKGLWAAAADVWSEVSVPVRGPGRPGPVRKVRLAPRLTSVLVRWDRARWAESYVVWWRRADSRRWHTVSTVRPRALLGHLRPDVRYTVSVQPVGWDAPGRRTRPQTVSTKDQQGH